MHTNRTETVVQIAARRTQMARRYYWSARFGGSDLRVRLAADGLRVSESHLINLCGGSELKARAAEVAYIDSLTVESGAAER